MLVRECRGKKRAAAKLWEDAYEAGCEDGSKPRINWNVVRRPIVGEPSSDSEGLEATALKL